MTLNYDQGILGSRTKAQADALVTEAVSLWTNVATSTVTLSRGPDLPVDVTSSNYSTFLYNFSDGLNPVIYDNDGSIIDSIFGVGAKNSVLGFAGSAWNNNGTQCAYTEGRAVISGYISVNDTTMKVVLAHETGHLIGLDHSQLDNSQGLVNSNYPLMYPIAYRSFTSLHEDDTAAVSALYPDATLASIYGQLTGSFTQANGTPIRGANIWAREVNTNKVFSYVSDYLSQNTGYFKLLLPPGSYTLHAEVIHTAFTAGSSVGPYSETSSDLSFQPPLYNNGVAIAPVVLGGNTPTQFSITAGCAASATFKMDGTGTVGGNCGADNLSPTVPTGLSATPVSSAQINLSWTASTDNVGVTGYKVYRGGVLVGSPATTSYNDTGLTASSSYSYTLAACDAANNCSVQSNPGSATTMSATSSSNVALASVGAVASASSTYSSAFPVAAVNDGQCTGATWGNGGGWNDATINTQPDWVQINFNGTKTIDRVVVYTIQDNYTDGNEPTDILTFSLGGITGFTIQGWNGSAWTTLATVSGNNLVKRTVSFAAFTTNQIRINVTSVLAGYSRIIEIEAWGVASPVVPDTTPPAVPTGLSATPVSSAQINLSWTASTDNVGVTGYKVYRGGVLVGSPATTSYNDTGLTASSSYSYTLAACDAANNCSVQSNPGSATTMSATSSSNVALASVGAVASASSTYSSAFPVAAVNDGQCTGATWGNGGGWNDATINTQPDWVQINFNGTKTIDRVVVYTIQDNYTDGNEPTDILTFSLGGITGFTIQGWNGSAWTTLATVSGNNLVKRTVSFAAFTTNQIRINVTSVLAGYSRIIEIEAWGVASPVVPDTTPPAVPTGLSATPVSSAQINLSWTASTDNVGVTGYKVYRGGVLVGSPATTSYNDTGLTASSSYSYTLAACDAANNCSVQSNPGSATTMSATSSSNVALASVGAVASASSTYSSAFPVAAVNDGQCTGATWGNGGGWNDATINTQPDWVQINFNGTKTIDRVVVYTIQDNYTDGNEPTDILTFSLGGITGFTIQGWNGSAWTTLATVSGNNLVKRTVSFAAFTTNQIRINVTSVLAGYSRIIEIEAWGVASPVGP
ncbi:fibronectin type III domain-containing protein [Candidatus Nitrotoga arctica]|uniref:fibronectin type III domain-containing protein n=1 Tax=Candidatus Nitrotoga arctica TaxID=453162 RepID=UPI001EFB0B44|nr:matrixin family metalloprotease [Candidatus Nitrotoga arctica]